MNPQLLKTLTFNYDKYFWFSMSQAADMRMINCGLSIIHHTIVEEFEQKIKNGSGISSEQAR